VGHGFVASIVYACQYIEHSLLFLMYPLDFGVACRHAAIGHVNADCPRWVRTWGAYRDGNGYLKPDGFLPH
jgi:hypothetical protein